MAKANPPFSSTTIGDAFSGFPEAHRQKLLRIRAIIFEISSSDDSIGPVEESLKWGQPSYATPLTKSGSPIRLGLTKSGDPVIFAHCQTTIITDFAALNGQDFIIEGNRAVHIGPLETAVQIQALRHLIATALTYHL